MTSGEQRATRSIEAAPVGELIAAIGQKTPTPGGGAVAAVTAALAAAIARMVVSFSTGRKSLAQHAALHDEALATLQESASSALRLADADADAYGHLSELFKLDKDDPARVARWPDAVAAAIAAPRAVLEQSMRTLRLLSRLAGATNPQLNSDLAIAAVLAEAAARAAAWNVRVNLPLLSDAEAAQSINTHVNTQLLEAQQLSASVEASCRSSF